MHSVNYLKFLWTRSYTEPEKIYAGRGWILISARLFIMEGYGVTISEGEDAAAGDEYTTVSDGTEKSIVVTNALQHADLKITKVSVSDLNKALWDESQMFVYQIEGIDGTPTEGFKTSVTVMGEGTATVKNKGYGPVDERGR